MNTEKFEKTYAMLNPEQADAVNTLDGPVMVIAGPGTGKTQIIGMRTANIILKA
jgi:DNA helicase-2/ATP-dependent DNA helicase PcrA